MKNLAFLLSVSFLMLGRSFGTKMPDTSSVVVVDFSAGLSFAFNNSINWKGLSGGSVFILNEIDIEYSRVTTGSTRLCNIKSDIGFEYFFDSLWNKQADQLEVRYLYKRGVKSLSNTFSSGLSTHYLESYSYETDGSGALRKVKTENMFNPSQFEIGLGTAYTFSKTSLINFSLATALLKLLPMDRENSYIEGIPLGRVADGNLFFDYGFSIQFMVNKEFGKFTELESNGKIFLKGFNNDQVDMDVSNGIIVKITKFLRMKSVFKFIYDPAISYKPQYYSELVLGIYYNSNAKHQSVKN